MKPKENKGSNPGTYDNCQTPPYALEPLLPYLDRGIFESAAGAQFPTAWFTWKLNLPQQMNFARLNKPKRSELEEYWKEALGQ